MTTTMGPLLRRPRAPKPAPMAIPLDPDAHKPLGSRFGDWVHGIVTRRMSAAGQRVLSWTLLAIGLGIVGIAYLVQTSYVASIASQRAALESTTTAVQDANARLVAQVAEAQAIGKAAPAAREQGLSVVAAGSVAYLTAPIISEPTVAPTVVPTGTPGPSQRVTAALVGRASVDAPPPPPVGTAATAEAAARPAVIGNLPAVTNPGTQPPATRTGGTP